MEIKNRNRVLLVNGEEFPVEIYAPELKQAGFKTMAANSRDEAVDLIAQLLDEPSALTVHLLRLDPIWDPIRDNPRFQALLAKYEN